MMDEEIMKTVESMLGKDVKIVDCEKTSSVRQEEVLLINGIPVTLEGRDGDAIKSALMTGQVPSCELLNQLLYQAGILRQPIQLETSLSVKSTLVTKEEVKVARDGRILDERTSETKEDNFYTSSSKEIWEPVISSKTKKTLAEEKDLASRLLKTKLNEMPTLQATKTESLPTNHIFRSFGSWNERDRKSTSISPSSSSNTLMTGTTTTTATASTADECSKNGFDDDDDDDEDEDEDDGDDEDDNEGSLYTISSNVASVSTFSNYPSSSLIFPLNNDTSFTSSPPGEDVDVEDELCSLLTKANNTKANSQKKLKENPTVDSNKQTSFSQSLTNDIISNSLSETNYKQKFGKNSSISCDSGHDDHFNSPSQTNFLLQTTNTDNSISSCYDFISSDEAECVLSQQLNKISSYDWSRENGGAVLIDEKFRPTTSLSKLTPSTQKSKSHQKILPQTNPVSLGKNLSGKINSSNTNDSAANNPSSLSSSSSTTAANSRQQRYNNPQQLLDGDNESDDLSLVYRDCNLVSGSLDALIQHMVPTCDYYPEDSFIFAFLLSARLFIRPHELLSRICDVWENQQLEYNSIDECDDAKTSPYNLTTVQNQSSKSIILANNKLNYQKALQNSQNFIKLLAEWIDTFPYDFRDERLMQHVRLVTKKCTAIDVNNLGKTASTILQNLVQRLTVLERYEEFLQSIAVYPQENFKNDLTSGLAAERSASSNSHLVSTCSSSSDNAGTTTHHHREHHRTDSHDSGGLSAFYKLSSSTSCHQSSDNSTNNSLSSFNSDFDIGELCPNPALLAHQLTHIELERLSHIGPEEFVQAFAKENLHLESFNDMKKTRNLEAYVQWFNRLSYFVATEIVKHPKKKVRVRVVEYWVETARGCFNIGNFNSLMAIIAGLNMSPISRLKKTWSKVPSDKFSVLEHQMDPTSNFNSYRSTLKAAMWRSAGATNERERIIIPFFSLLVKDLYFLNEGCSNRLPNGHINFEKFWQLAKQVQEFNTWKKVICPFGKQQKIIMFLQTSPVLNESTLSMASFECEPPENTQEKDRYKTLKSENKYYQQQLQ